MARKQQMDTRMATRSARYGLLLTWLRMFILYVAYGGEPIEEEIGG